MKMIKLTMCDNTTAYYNTNFILALEHVSGARMDVRLECGTDASRVSTALFLAAENLKVVYVQENLDDILERLYAEIL